jgi:hypothetical protein
MVEVTRVNKFRKHIFLAIFGMVSVGTALLLIWLNRSFPWEQVGSQSEPQAATAASRLQAREDEADKTVWAPEILAEKCGRVFESIWDSINASTNKLGVIASIDAKEFGLGRWGPGQPLSHGILLFESAGAGSVLRREEWSRFIENFATAGWRLDNVEFRHNRFDIDRTGQGCVSHFYFAARLTNPVRQERAVIEGDLAVEWVSMASNAVPAIKLIDARHLALKSQSGEPAFQLVLREEIAPTQKSVYIDPLIVYDLDGDGLSEIILAGRNLVYRRHGESGYEAGPLCRYPIDGITTAVIADFDGDGAADFLCANAKGLFLFKGSAQGTFEEPGRLVWAADPPLEGAMVLTCADIDHDGDLDLFLGQYKVPTLGQILRPYYYEANDGFPSHLLLNDGQGNFSDATEASGLGPKRWRRVYSASLADLDGDGHADLVTASDFAGLDLYHNDGHGHFTDVTPRWVAESHGFGMAHALADFNADGRLDLLMIGMPSPTVDRLEHLGLSRSYSTDDPQRRPAMTFGNRLYLARPEGGFEQTRFGDSIARSGWSWGCSAFDFDNDGFPDVYIANGLESKRSVQDYEGEFWLHDIFVDDKVDDVAATKYVMDKFSRTRGQGWSYGGYEKNRLYLNQRGESFVEIGHLAGVALEQDSRNVVTDDLDGDGRLDLLVTTQEVWPEVKQTLRIYKNNLRDAGHWIGFRFREQSGGKSPVGVRVSLHYDGHSAVRQIVTGDSHRSQHANTIHFGLGAAERVDRAEITWPDGSAVTLRQPSVDQYHSVRASAESSGLK